MSAFAALRDLGVSSLMSSRGSDEEDGPIMYQQNTSDEEEQSDQEAQETQDSGSLKPVSLMGSRSNSTSVLPSPVTQGRRPVPASFVYESKFTPNCDNLVVMDDHVIIGLKPHEYIVLNGQAKLTIQRGAVLVNNCHYFFAHPDKTYEVLATQSQSLPVIASTQVLDRSSGIEDTKTAENEHLFNSDYKSVIVLEDYHTGLEDIGLYSPPLKRFFYNLEVEEAEGVEASIGFALPNQPVIPLDFSFEVLLQNKGLTGLYIDRTWRDKVNELNMMEDPSVTMVIGNKNSGKSTFAKALLNGFVSKNAPVLYLDLDPGQSEFSMPYCMSLTSVDREVLGINIPLSVIDDSTATTSLYYGFTTPQLQPTRYLEIVKALWQVYDQVHRPRGSHLIINTPGWIKGFGKQLLDEITALARPDSLVYLTSSGILDPTDETLDALTYSQVHTLPGMYQVSKYSPAQLRTFNKLTYFHQQRQNGGITKFQFREHLLTSPPMRISYQLDKSDHSFVGINGVSILNYDTGLQFNQQDLLLMLDASIVGLYLVDNELFMALLTLQEMPGRPLYLNSNSLEELVRPNDSHNIFMGLCMIHSINKHEQYFNVYFPNESNVSKIKERLQDGYKLIFVKGDGDLPVPEVLMPQLVQQQLDIFKKQRKNKPVEQTKMPYVSFESKNKVGGVWKIRRNVMRRGHQR